jgi:hypothetical protein
MEESSLVRRKCRVCEWEAEALEGARRRVDCPWCHAPTLVVARAVVAPSVDGKNPHAAALGRLGGIKGGPARAARLSPRRRREIARKAAAARWHR